MPLTYTGRLVDTRDETTHPSLVDLAVGMSRQPRFGGQTRIWWSVLDHALFCDDLARSRDDALLGEWRLAMLLHDAHEALTGDVPSPLKGQDMRDTQRLLDIKIMGAFFPGGIRSYDAWHRDVAAIDSRALLAEARVVLTATPERIKLLFGGGEQAEEDAKLLVSLLGVSPPAFKPPTFGVPPFPDRQHEHRAVVEFLARVARLL